MPKLPSLHALRAFEAAARHQAFNRAADELNISPTAVSHHIRGLESELGVALFNRGVRTVTLTGAGQQLSKECTKAFDTLIHVTHDLRQTNKRRTVRIALGPYFASRWLAPRLAKFWQAFPQTDLQFVHSPLQILPRLNKADLFIAWGKGDWPGFNAEKLLSVSTVPVASPTIWEQLNPYPNPEALLQYPLLHQRDYSGWRDWFETHGISLNTSVSGTVIEDANVVLRSAMDSQGIALGWLPLVSEDIQAGRLKALYSPQLETSRAYYLLKAENEKNNTITEQIYAWMLDEAYL